MSRKPRFGQLAAVAAQSNRQRREAQTASSIEAKRANVERRPLSREADAELILRQLDKAQGNSSGHWPLLIRLALETGARARELLQASRGQFDFDRRVWRLPADPDKYGAARNIPLSETAMNIVERLDALAKPGDPRLLHPLGSPSEVAVKFARFAKRAGADGLHFHGLRQEAFARMVLRERRLPVAAIMAAFGYSGAEILERGERIRAGRKLST